MTDCLFQCRSHAAGHHGHGASASGIAELRAGRLAAGVTADACSGEVSDFSAPLHPTWQARAHNDAITKLSFIDLIMVTTS